MVNNPQAFISAIQNLTGEGTVKELVDFGKKWLDEMVDKISNSDLDRILNGMNENRYTFGHICALIVKLAKIKTNAEMEEFINQMNTAIYTFNDIQVFWAPDIYTRLFQNLTDRVLKRDSLDCALLIPILTHAVSQLSQDQPNRLTNLHASLFSLCLKARQFNVALPFFCVNVIHLFLGGTLTQPESSYIVSQFKDVKCGFLTPDFNAKASNNNNGTTLTTNSLDVLNSSTINDVLMPVDTTPFQIAKVQLNYRPVLLFFYYGAMILAAMRHYKAAFLYLEHAICLPATRLSAITLECLKKYILIGLILDYPNPLLKLPDYRPNVIQRIAVPMAITYVRMAQVYAKARINHQDVAEAVQNYLQPHREDFQKDENFDLAQRVIAACKEKAIQRLANVFVSLSLSDVSTMAHINDETETEKLVDKLVNQHDLNAQFEPETRMIIFGPQAPANSESITCEQLEKALSECGELSALIHSVDDVIRMTPNYIQKQNRSSGGGNNLIIPISSMATSSGINLMMMDDEGASLSPPS